MAYQPFHELFKNIAEKETRTVIILEENQYNLPSGSYVFTEMFCNDRKCNCARVLFSVMLHQNDASELKAVIAYGWGNDKFYRNWLGEDDKYMISEMQGPILNKTSCQSDIAENLLHFLKEQLLSDTEYIERLKRHYSMFRTKINSKYSYTTTRERKRKKVNKNIRNK